MQLGSKLKLTSVLGMLAAIAPLSAYAQTSGSPSGQPPSSTAQRSWIPHTSYGYVGANLGRTDYSLGGCSGIFSCDDNATGFKLYTGGRMSRYFGLELGYFHLGDANRNGGDVRAQGANLTLLGNIPFTDNFGLYGKLGGAYGWTKTTTAIPGVASGNENGLGLHYGAGLQYDITKAVALRADWDRFRLKYPGERENADLYSIGVVFKF